MKLSIVSTLYQSENHIKEFHQRVSAVAKELVGDDYEIILVNDGSPDGSLELASMLAHRDSHLVVIDLSRNFGHHKAMMTGLAYAAGEHVFLLDSDLEEEPEWLLSFARQVEEDQCDVVFGVQERRKGNYFEQISGALFYRIFRLFTNILQPDNIVTARLMSKRYVRALLEHKEREINIGGLWVITGFLQCRQKVVKHSTSATTYSIVQKLGHLVTAITSFSSLPLVLTFYVGLIISAVSGLYVSYLVINYFFFYRPVDGYTSLIASIWFLSGLIIFFLGVQGVYLSKIYIEVKRRPYTIVRDIIQKTRSQGLDKEEF